MAASWCRAFRRRARDERSMGRSCGNAWRTRDEIIHAPGTGGAIRSMRSLFWEHRYDSSRTRAAPRSAKDLVEKDLGRNPSQLGLEKLEQGRVECARPPPISAQARRDRVDHQFSRSLATAASRKITRAFGRRHCSM